MNCGSNLDMPYATGDTDHTAGTGLPLAVLASHPVEAGSQPSTPSLKSKRARRRNRPIASCLECRRRKTRCDKQDPCSRCVAAKRNCVYALTAMDQACLSKLKDIKDSIEHDLVTGNDINLERRERGPNVYSRLPNLPIATMSRSEDNGSDDEKDLKPSSLAVGDIAYYDDDDIDEESEDENIWDLGFRLGGMRLNERVGGYIRPRIAEEINASLEYEASKIMPPLSDYGDVQETRFCWTENYDYEDYLAPGQNFLTLQSDFMFGSPLRQESACKYLPSKYVADRLLEQYWNAVHPVARAVHRLSFEQKYTKLWCDVINHSKSIASTEAVVLAALFAGAVSISDPETFQELGSSRTDLIDKLQKGTELALQRANVSRTTKIETFQALIIYMIPLCRDEISRAHSVLVGAAVRLAQCIGLHRDPSEYAFSPVKSHVRRLLWYQLCYLDLRTSEVQGPKPFIQCEDYTTKLPAEINDDSDIVSTFSSPDGPSDITWTDVSFSRIRFECQEMQRLCLIFQTRLGDGSARMTDVLGRIGRFEKEMHARYGPILQNPTLTPIQRMARVMMSALIAKLYLSILHRYMNSVVFRIPDRLRQIVLEKGTVILESAVELEMAPALRPWVWYARAYQQYHTAFLLLFEVFQFPMRVQADRIWRCLDYVYALRPLSIPPEVTSRHDIIRLRNCKASFILEEFTRRMKAYLKKRKICPPVSMAESLVLITPQRAGDRSDPTLPLNYAHSDQTPTTSSSRDAVEYNLAQDMTRPFDNLTMGNPRLPQPRNSNHTDQPLSVGQSDILDMPYSGEVNLSMNDSSEPSDAVMIDIEWDEWDSLFPPEVNDGALDMNPDLFNGNLELLASMTDSHNYWTDLDWDACLGS